MFIIFVMFIVDHVSGIIQVILSYEFSSIVWWVSKCFYKT